MYVHSHWTDAYFKVRKNIACYVFLDVNIACNFNFRAAEGSKNPFM